MMARKHISKTLVALAGVVAYILTFKVPSKEIVHMKILICIFVTAWCGAAAAAEYADGKLGKGLILDGSSHTVKIPHYAGLKPDKAITVSAWIKPERVGKGGWQWQEIYRKEDGNARVLFAIGEREKKHSLCFGLGVGGKFVEQGAALEPARLLDGKWHLVSVTFDGKAIKILRRRSGNWRQDGHRIE